MCLILSLSLSLSLLSLSLSLSLSPFILVISIELASQSMASKSSNKRRRVERRMPETWCTFLEELPGHDIVDENVPELLERQCSNLVAFRQLSKTSQQILLKETLGESCPLIEQILTCCETVSLGRVDLALKCELAPSSRLSYIEVAEVLNAILGVNYKDMMDICHYLTSLPKPNPNPSSPTKIEIPTESFRYHYEKTLYLGDKEASGRVLLGLFMIEVCHALKQMHPEKEFWLDHECLVLPKKTFACDEAIHAILDNRQKVIFALEYKPKVAPELIDQTSFHISETLLQAFYLRKRFDHNIVHCLTDLADYHFFLCGKSDEGIFCIQNYWYQKCNLTEKSELEENITFLTKVICDCLPELQLPL